MSTELTRQTAGDLQVYVLGSHWDSLATMSPFGMKLATWVRMVDLPHELVIEDDPRKGPKKKSPWIVERGQTMGDSELIIEHLKKSRGIDPDAHLTPTEQAMATALRRMFEEHFAQILDYSLFTLDIGWEQSKAHFDAFLPPIIGPFIAEIIRKDCRKESYIRGIGRHSVEEIERMARADLAAASAFLVDKPFFFGDRPTTTDCSIYGFLSITLWAPIPYFAQRELEQHANLVAWCERMRERFWAVEPVPRRVAA